MRTVAPVLLLAPVVRSLTGDPETIHPGDLVEIHDYLLPVGEPGAYRYRIDWKDVTTPLFRVGEDGAEALVALAVKRAGDRLTGGARRLSRT